MSKYSGNFLRLLFSALALIYLSGCTHTVQTASTAPPAAPGELAAPRTPHHVDSGKEDTETDTPLAAAPRTLSEKSGSSETCETVLDSREGVEGIDRALELCESAQTLWEAGELDSAMSELDIAYATILDLDLKDQLELNQQKEDLRYMIAKRILEIYASRHIVVAGKHKAIPITLNKHVTKEINRFTGPEKKFFLRSLKRAGRYRPYIVKEFKKAGLPEELSWLPLIESGFQVKALSPARALGLWQFIPSTGYKFGLERNYYIDERLDPEKSTQAAIAYLTELHNIFGDWATVLAAYNCGEGRVLRIIRKQKTNYIDNFWDLYKNLPRETARYVPRFLATLHILGNMDKYDMHPEKIDAPIPHQAFTVKKQVRLKDIAADLKIPLSTLKALNPELRYALLPADSYELNIPAAASDNFLARFNRIKPKAAPARTSSQKFVYHRIKRGENLSLIARKYCTSVKRLTTINHLSSRSVLRIGKVLKVPAGKTRVASAGSKSRVSRKSTAVIRYKVKAGDNLWLLANKYHTTTKHIMAVSKIRSTRLHIGQVLKIPGGGKSVTTKRQKTTMYRVKSGDNPFTIARKYNMNLQRLLTLNHLTAKSRIYPGQKLLVE